ncbi:MAG: response regulator [Deltaproteobacteria bacterium]|nr:response regulator [Deltaproteobacteria bacterium]
MKDLKILLVDDEVIFTENMSKLLKSRGYPVKAVNEGSRAIRELEEDNFDVVVLDLKMPGMDGISMLKEINNLGILTEVLILTGHGSIDVAMEAIKLGAYDYLIKPCEIDDLIEKIEEAGKKKDRNENQDVDEEIQGLIESSSSVYDFFPKVNNNK